MRSSFYARTNRQEVSRTRAPSLEGAEATLVLADLHKVARLYVNFFQPSFKLKSKTREAGKVVKKYHAPATPYEQLVADERVDSGVKQRLRQQFASLDPLELLSQIRQAQQEIARLEAGAATEPSPAILELDQFVRSLETAWRHGEVRAPYRKRRSDAKPHTWRTRPDPYEEVWPLLLRWLNEEPHATAKASFGDLIRKCRTGSNLGNIELFNAGLKIGEPQLLDDWSLAATTTQTQSSCRAEAMTLHSLVWTAFFSSRNQEKSC